MFFIQLFVYFFFVFFFFFVVKLISCTRALSVLLNSSTNHFFLNIMRHLHKEKQIKCCMKFNIFLFFFCNKTIYFVCFFYLHNKHLNEIKCNSMPGIPWDFVDNIFFPIFFPKKLFFCETVCLAIVFFKKLKF